MRPFPRLLAAAMLAAPALLLRPAPGLAQMETREGIALQNQILELRHELQLLAARVEAGGGGQPSYQEQAPPPAGSGGDLSAELLDRVSRLEEQVRTLQGRVDELSNTLQQQTADLGKQISDLNFRLNGGTTPPATGVTPPPGPGVPPAPATPGTLPLLPPAPGAGPEAAKPPPRTPEMALQEGRAALARRDYAAAEAAAREVLANGRSPRTVDAMFLLAQAEAGQRNYQKAAVDYYDTYNRAHGGAHAQDALLGVANSLIALGDKRSACGALDKLRAEYHPPRDDLHGAIASARSRANCH
ncbi:MAG TPA: tetratricopeptide repeat protein [Acetobacteraceae bacterium]|nr:tetratricopeptide repeat protein [Acetobacteraceae bacterium]